MIRRLIRDSSLKKLPPYFLNSDENSFARKTFMHRKPAIIKKIIDANDFNDVQIKALEGLASDLTGGVVRNPFNDFPCSCEGLEPGFKKIWNEELLPYLGKKWLELPFYFAEALLYFEILVASGYFDPSSNSFMKDIYQRFKDEELLGENGALRNISHVISIIESPEEQADRIRELVYFSLWGNRIDLSMYHLVEDGKSLFLSEDSRKQLLIDHSAEVSECILDAERIDFVLDNAGQELVCDLLLVWAILSSTEKTRIFLHFKKYPFYVSDAMVKDFYTTIDSFRESSSGIKTPQIIEIEKDLRKYLHMERLKVREHYFWNSPLSYFQLPEELYREFENTDIVIFKGDVNYRRLLDDRKWNISEDMRNIVGYFPTSLAVIRTMKSELVVDIPEEMAKRLESEDPEWMVNGLRGMIRLVKLE